MGGDYRDIIDRYPALGLIGQTALVRVDLPEDELPAGVQILASKDVVESGEQTEALNMAQMQMERTRSLGFNNAVSDSGMVGDYRWTTIVAPVKQGLNSVTVSVQWEEQGVPQTKTLRSLLSIR